ncbi:hypothetical protein INR49_010938 [Caranx melampygus]|nr:hypothetical protein INR49_010938 [Caranx melampygus]
MEGLSQSFEFRSRQEVPGLLCGFYSKITIPESNLIGSAHGLFTGRVGDRTDVELRAVGLQGQ